MILINRGLKLKRNCAISAISGFVVRAASTGASPNSFSDCALLVPNEIEIYGIHATKEFLTAMFISTIGASSTSLLEDLLLLI